METDLTGWLLTTYGQEQMRPGLDRIASALKNLLPEFSKTKVVIIAGTNGKGETTLRLSELLKNSSQCVWTSPHIQRITERFRDEHGEISEEELKNLIQQSHEEVLRHKYELSFYEFLFLVFCTWAAKKKPEYLLLEVGLGGRLDAVNVFDAELVLLPSISRDHQEFLGPRFDLILKEKLGTLRKGSQLIHFLETQYLADRAEEIAQSIGAKVLDLRKKSTLPCYEFSARNHLLAAAAVCHLDKRAFHPEEWPLSLSSLENRGEFIKRDSEYLFFGSHNVDGLRKLIQFLHSDTYNFPKAPFDIIIAAFSRRDERDLRIMLRMLRKSNLGKLVVTTFSHPKAASPDVMKRLVSEEGSEFAEDIRSYVQGPNKNQRVLVTGSYYFLGDFKSRYCR